MAGAEPGVAVQRRLRGAAEDAPAPPAQLAEIVAAPFASFTVI